MKKKIQFELSPIGKTVYWYCLMIKYSDSNVGSKKHWSRVGFGPRLMFKARLLQYPLQTWNGLTLFI